MHSNLYFLQCYKLQVQEYMDSESGYKIPFDEHVIKELYQSYSHEAFKKSLNNVVTDRAMGCLFGSFIGDALGAYLEFAKEKDFGKMMKDVMEMPGGGIFGVKSGQVTDDSELAFHLLNAMTNFDFKSTFPAQRDNLIINIAYEYLCWGDSRPFDIGITCRNSLEAIRTVFNQNGIDRNHLITLQPSQAKQLSQQIHEKVYKVSKESQSNGSLMRIAPLPFFFGIFNKGSNYNTSQEMNTNLGISKDEMMSFVFSETSLLHPNETLKNVSYLWSTMLTILIKRKDDKELKSMYQMLSKEFQRETIGWGKFVNQPIDAQQKIGWSKIAVSLGLKSFRNIVNSQTICSEGLYEKEIKYVLSKGGDTDTNAAIVGGLLGAIVGFKKLPVKYIQRLMNLRHTLNKDNKRINRPNFYEPRVAFANAYKLIKIGQKLN